MLNYHKSSLCFSFQTQMNMFVEMRTIHKHYVIIRVPDTPHTLLEICTLYTAAISVVNLHILNICSTESIYVQHRHLCPFDPFHNFCSGLSSAFICHVADNLCISSNKGLISFRHQDIQRRKIALYNLSKTYHRLSNGITLQPSKLLFWSCCPLIDCDKRAQATA